jgi:hypothetical protein
MLNIVCDSSRPTVEANRRLICRFVHAIRHAAPLVQEYIYAKLSMPVPAPTRCTVFLIPASARSPALSRCLASHILAAAFLSLFCIAAQAAKPRPAEFRFELEKLGYPGVSQRVLAEGGTLLTVHFAGENHILLTYATRGLLPRLPDDRPGDQDRMVAALLLELPSGRVVGRTEWRLHDRARYLWPLGGGVFLVRIQDALSTMNPVANLPGGHPFERTVFAPANDRIDAVVVTPDRELVTVETSHAVPQASSVKRKAVITAAKLAARPHFATDAHAPAPPTPFILPDPPAETSPTPVTASVETYRMFKVSGRGTIAEPVHAQLLGRLTVGSVVSLPLFLDGYLKDAGQNRNEWNIDFHSFAGRDYMLPTIDSSCSPTIYRVSPAQFLSVNCRGITGNVMLAAYDLAQHEMWEEPLPASLGLAAYATAPAAGRFAVSRIVSAPATHAAGAPADQPQDNTTSQEVRVYQTQSGDLLLKVECTPAFKALENFDLSPDGLRAVVIRDGAIEVHRLPALTRRDKDDLVALEAEVPKAEGVPFDLRAFAGTTEIEPTVAAEASSAPATAAALPSNANIIRLGDAGQRPAPTLLKEGEKPEFEDKSTEQPK